MESEIENKIVNMLAHIYKAYKPETNLMVGSSAIRLSNELKDKNIQHEMYDPYVDTELKAEQFLQEPQIYFIATKHDDFVNYNFPKGSIIIDPFRYIPTKEGITVIPIGKPIEPQAKITQ